MNVSFSIITPVFNPPRDAFDECVRSVLEQDYPHWQWCLANDCSTDDWVQPELDRLAALDPRISVVHRSENGGISRASNSALEHATGDFITFLDHDDMLTPDALGVVNHYLHLNPGADFFYSDEDKVGPVGQVGREGQFFGRFDKPDWSPERLLCQNYCCHLVAVERSIYEQIGGLRPEYDGAQDYDFVLRATEVAIQVVHIPQVLYHWRAIPGSTAYSIDAKPYAVDAGRRTTAAALARRGINGEVRPSSPIHHRVKRTPKWNPTVSIIIPTAGTRARVFGLELPLVLNMVHSVDRMSTYPNVEFVIVADTPVDPDLMSSLSKLVGDFTLVEYSKPFNFSDKCNLGALAASGDVLIFANDDLEVISPDWIESLIGFLEEPDVGAVGPLLRFANFTIQTAGHTVDASDFARQDPRSNNAIDPLIVNRECVGLSAACLAIRKHTFESVGGFSMEFPRSYNDVDLCFKLRDLGHRIIWTPDAELFHFESQSRDPDVKSSERLDIERRWLHQLSYDPYLRIKI